MYVFDKSDPNNIQFPQFIEDISDDELHELIPKFVEKYRSKKYKTKDRDQLDDEKVWNDLEVALLIKFYQKGWSFIILNEDEFFPHFVYTYNVEPLKKEIDKIVGHLIDRLSVEDTKRDLLNGHKYSSLDITYLLHYFSMRHPDYKEE
jgi:hypothetical protein